MKPTLLIAATLLTILVGCGIKTNFNESELKWMDVYNEGDTLIFQSGKGELDTSIIIKKELFYPEYNPIEVHDQYLPQWGVVWYKNKHLKNHPDGYKMVSIIKKHPKDKTYLNIGYLYSSVLVLNLTSNSIEKNKRGEIYEFDTYHPRAESFRPRTIYWHERSGVVRYITHDSTEWKLVDKR